jgi:F-type H+-transporting ATPase subunit delta
LSAVAQRYAEALADVALAQGSAEAVRGELRALAEVVRGSADLRNFLASPAVPRPDKQGVMEKLVARMGGSRALRNFLFVLVENRRAALLGEISEVFEDVLHARLGIAEAEITSARELSGAEKEELLRALERMTGKKVEAKYGLDPELLGGARVRIGSTIYDGTVRERLNRLQARLAGE